MLEPCYSIWVERSSGKQRGEEQQQAEGRGEQRGAEGSRGKQRESEGSAGKDREAEGSTGRQKKAEGSTEEQREAEGSRGKHRGADCCFPLFFLFSIPLLPFPLLPSAYPCCAVFPLCFPLPPFAHLCFPGLHSASIRFPLPPSASLCCSLLLPPSLDCLASPCLLQISSVLRRLAAVRKKHEEAGASREKRREAEKSIGYQQT